MNLNKRNIVLTIVLLFLIIVTLVLLFNVRDLSQNPVIDVVITSLSSIIAAVVAASVAYYVAHLQITHQSQELKEKRVTRYFSALQLLSHEIQYNKQVLDSAVAQSQSPDLNTFLEKNITVITWNQVSFDIIQDLNRDLVNSVSTLYYKMLIMKQGFTQTSESIQQTFTLCVTIDAQIKAELDKNGAI